MTEPSSSLRRSSSRAPTAPGVAKPKPRDVALAIYMRASRDPHLNVAQACRELDLNPKSYDYYRKLFIDSITPSSIDSTAVIAAVHPAAAQVDVTPVEFPYLSGKVPATPVATLRAIKLMKGKNRAPALRRLQESQSGLLVWCLGRADKRPRFHS